MQPQVNYVFYVKESVDEVIDISYTYMTAT